MRTKNEERNNTKDEVFIKKPTMSATFNSEGFDLDALPGGGGNDNDNAGGEVVFELGGNATTVTSTSNRETTSTNERTPNTEKENPLLAKSEAFKSEGNSNFKEGNYLDAYDSYSDAIEACPGISGEEIIQLRDEHAEKEREKSHARYERDADRRRKPHAQDESEDQSKDANDDDVDDKFKETEFEVPENEFGEKLAVYHCNRAACLLHLSRYEDAIEDCDVAILLNKKYVKAHVRRMTAYEKTERTEEALRDAKAAQEIDPRNMDIRKHVKRLQKIEDARLEKLKEETMGKLKDLGNSILGNFGMSLDNFNAQKDPNTGSYNISFNNN